MNWIKKINSWKTTLVGFLVGIYPLVESVIEAYNAGYFTDKTGSQFWIGLGIIVLGYLSKDHNVTGGTVQRIGGTNPPPVKDEK